MVWLLVLFTHFPILGDAFIELLSWGATTWAGGRMDRSADTGLHSWTGWVFFPVKLVDEEVITIQKPIGKW